MMSWSVNSGLSQQAEPIAVQSAEGLCFGDGFITFGKQRISAGCFLE
jgi:hypothetical protein